jgi:hypothetical protein
MPGTAAAYEDEAAGAGEPNPELGITMTPLTAAEVKNMTESERK